MTQIEKKKIAIKLRKNGYSYSEILKKVPVAKSTLSLWLRNLRLDKEKEQRLIEKKKIASIYGGRARRNKRLSITKEIREKAKKEIGQLSDRELWLIGITLYWAEGTKQKENNVSERVKFSNSDPKMIKVFIDWLQKICKVPKSNIVFRIALHESAKGRLKEIQKHWSDVTGFSIDGFQKIDWKRHLLSTNRKNVKKDYFGVLHVYVNKSTNFNRKISGWIEGIYEATK